jgi:mannose-6-phosphate isomerase-like protein (cupin superfamily)
MSYEGGGEVRAVLRRAADQERVASATVLADVDLTGGRYSLYRIDVTPGGGALPHFHRTFAETFTVISGRVELYDGTTWAEAHEGDHLWIPEGGIHAFRNPTDELAVLHMASIPGIRREAYFAELVAVATEGRALSPEEWTELYARHDQYMV